MPSIRGLLTSVALVVAVAGLTLTVRNEAQADDNPHWGQNEKYDGPTIPLVGNMEQSAHICANLDYYGVRSDVLKATHSELVSWGRPPSEAKAFMDAVVVELCPEYLDEYTALSRTPVLRR